MTELNQIDLQALATGNKRTWDAFVTAAGLYFVFGLLTIRLLASNRKPVPPPHPVY